MYSNWSVPSYYATSAFVRGRYVLSICIPLKMMSEHRNILLSLSRAASTGRYLDQLEAPQEVNEAKLKCLREWTERRLDAVILTVSGKDRNFYRLHCEPLTPFFLLSTPVFSPVTDDDTAY